MVNLAYKLMLIQISTLLGTPVLKTHSIYTSFLGLGITKYHRLSDLHSMNLLSHSSGG